MDLSIEPTGFHIENPKLQVILKVQARRSIEDEETIVYVKAHGFPTFAFRAELRPNNGKINWCWNGSVKSGKQIARQTMTNLRAALVQAQLRESPHGPAYQYRQHVLSALPRS